MAKIRLKKNNVIVRNFLKIALFCFLAVCIAAFFINQYAVRVIETEVLQSNANTAANLQERTEEVLYQCRGIAAYLATDTMAQSFFWSEQPGRVYANFYLQLQNKLNAYAQGIDYIDSIYLYSPVSQKIIASRQAAPVSDAEDFRDMGWLENLEQVQDDIRCFSRSIRNEFDYPHVYTMILHRYLTGVESVVVVNVDLQKLFKTVASHSDGCYIVDGKERIILRRIKTALYEPMDSVPRMSVFRSEEKTFSCIGKDSEGAYAFSQLYSSTDDLYYISISSQNEYFGRLAKTSWLVVIGAVFVALTLCLAGLLFTFKNLRSVQSIINLLDSPENQLDKAAKNSWEVQYIADRIITNIQSNQELHDELNRKMQLLNQTQLQALQMQVNPHFLFNTINLIELKIAMDAGEDYAPVVMLRDLSQLLRYSVESTELVPLLEEKQYTEFYLHLLKARYCNSFDASIEISPEIQEVPVPRLFLQPLIENAVFHGFSQRMAIARGQVRIRGERTEENGRPVVRLLVEDNGEGMEPEVCTTLQKEIDQPQQNGGTHIGIRNVSMRLQLLYQENYRMTVESQKKQGTRITIILPMERLVFKWTATQNAGREQ